MNWIRKLINYILIAILLVALNYSPINIVKATAENDDTIVDTVIFPHNEVVNVNIEIEEDVYEKMNANAISEEVVEAKITYNGYTFDSIGIRTKGNSSLRDVAKTDSDRYSFKIDFNYYLNNQSFYGITKINLNNIFSDPSMMAEYLGYEMLEEIDAVSSRTTYVALSINGKYFGLYLAVEQVNDPFLIENFGDDSGELYKPDTGVGADLDYISDDGSDYTGLFPENMDDYNNEAIVKLVKTIEDGGELDSILNVDSFLKYLAVSTMTIHLDGYQGGMFHNYYLYNNNGIFEWIAWDLNMIFNGFHGAGLSDDEAIQYLIDEPVTGVMEKYPLVEAIFENGSYVEKYHEYLEILSENYLEEDNINEKILSIYEMIKDYVEIDPTAFYTYEQFEEALFQDSGNNLSLLSFIEKRVENVSQQLSGEILSSNNGEGNTGSSGMGDKGNRDFPNNNEMGGQIPEDIEGKAGQIPTNIEGIVPQERPQVMGDEIGQQRPNNIEGKVDQMPANIEDEISNIDIINRIVLLLVVILVIVASFILSKKQN